MYQRWVCLLALVLAANGTVQGQALRPRRRLRAVLSVCASPSRPSPADATPEPPTALAVFSEAAEADTSLDTRVADTPDGAHCGTQPARPPGDPFGRRARSHTPLFLALHTLLI